jgi:hypothetical protein
MLMVWRQLKLLLAPSSLGVVLYCIATTVVLVGSVFSSLVSRFITFSNTPDAPALLHSYIRESLLSSTSYSILGPATTFVLWASLGAVVYLIAWSLVSVFIVARNDFVIGTKYTSIETHGHLLYWTEMATRLLVRLGAGLLIVILTAVVVGIWYPVSVTIIKTVVAGEAPSSYWFYGLVSIVGWLLVWHLYTVFVRLALLKTRIIS